MGPDVFIDTNVLVYAVDDSEPAKQAIAMALLNALARAGRGAISTQVLGEFFRAVTVRLRLPLSSESAARMVGWHARTWTVRPVLPATVALAIEGHVRFGFPYWDAQLWASALMAGTPIMLTEDLPSTTEAAGVHFVDPFAEGFSLALLGL